MAWRRSGDKPLSETMLVRLPTHICATWPQWVKVHRIGANFTQRTSYEMLIKWKSSSICEWEAISTILSKEIRFLCFVYYFDTDNLERLADHNLFNQYNETHYHQLIVSVMDRSDIVTQLDFYLNGTLGYIMFTSCLYQNDVWKFSRLRWYTDIVFNHTYNHDFEILSKNSCISISLKHEMLINIFVLRNAISMLCLLPRYG